MEALQALIRKKDALEAEAESLTEQLSASNMGGTSGPLVDREGFPRADVDVHATRLLRNRLACLNTDHRELMGQIEQSMHALHAAAAADGTVSTGSAPAARSTPAAAAPSGSDAPAPSAAANGHTQLKPFALVDSVDPAGPAAAAGLQVGDPLPNLNPSPSRSRSRSPSRSPSPSLTLTLTLTLPLPLTQSNICVIDITSTRMLGSYGFLAEVREPEP